MYETIRINWVGALENWVFHIKNVPEKRIMRQPAESKLSRLFGYSLRDFAFDLFFLDLAFFLALSFVLLLPLEAFSDFLL